jgi:SIR2-like domain
LVDYNIGKELLEAIKNDKLVIFVGSGLSKRFDFPDWKGLVAKILKELSDKDSSYEDLIPVLNNGFFSEIEILDKVLEMDSLNKKLVYEILIDTFEKDLSSMDLNNQKKIGELSGKIITTNYDNALETALPTSRKIIPANNYHIANMDNNDNFIFKVHGCIENPENCILFSSDYKNLYLEKTAAVERLKNIISDKTILFIGFSFNDQYIKDTFKYIFDVYSSFSSRHFIITTDEIDYKEYGLVPIKIESWTSLTNVLDYLITHKSKIKSNKPQIVINNEDEIRKENIRIALLFALPVDMEPVFSMENVIKGFRKYKITLDIFHLSEENLNELEDYNYVFLFTKSVKNKILIEDEFFKSKLSSISKIVEHIPQSNQDGIFIILKKGEMIKELEPFDHPLAIYEHDENINNLLFKLFKKLDLKGLPHINIYNEHMFKLTPLEKGNLISENKVSHTQLSEKIERKNLLNFIGRKTDIADIIRKVIDAKDKIITIKGSGGIGKTSIVKKVALEFCERGYFPEGINFLDCEFLKDYQTFERNLAKCFNLENSINLIEHMKQNQNIQDSIVILDNYEPLLHVEESLKMKQLITFVSNYTTILITSREWLDLDFEEKHELRAFTTEEALALFEKHYSYKIIDEDKKFLKEEILEKLLNNNPLAIKLITKNLPKSVSMEALRDDLEKDFFRATNSGYEDIFDDPIDSNIEKSKSLYQSIYYSYIRLNTKEQLVFEILSLFPNGIHMEFFKDFFNSEEFKLDIYRITNKEIKSLENKSLIEINGGFIKLQSIIGRFADYNLNKRTLKEKSKYYSRAFDFNSYLLSILNKIENEEGIRTSLEIFDKNEDNFIKCFEYMTEIEIDDDDLLISVITSVNKYCGSIGHGKKVRNKHEQLTKLLNHLSEGENFLETMFLYSMYFEGEFEQTFEILKRKYPLDQLNKFLSIENELVKINLINRILSLYSMEGYEIKVLEFIDKNQMYDSEIKSLLFKLGLYQDITEVDSEVDFFTYEILYNLNKINIDELEDYLSNGIYEKQFIEIIQTNYIKTKMGMLEKGDIQHLVVSNPYTMGLKDLMLAMVEEEKDLKIQLFEKAVENLYHIKYYYIEGIFIYSKFLKDIKSEKLFYYWSSLGETLAKQHNYQYLEYKFASLSGNNGPGYKEKTFENINVPIIIKGRKKELV